MAAETSTRTTGGDQAGADPGGTHSTKAHAVETEKKVVTNTVQAGYETDSPKPKID